MASGRQVCAFIPPIKATISRSVKPMRPNTSRTWSAPCVTDHHASIQPPIHPSIDRWPAQINTEQQTGSGKTNALARRRAGAHLRVICCCQGSPRGQGARRSVLTTTRPHTSFSAQRGSENAGRPSLTLGPPMASMETAPASVHKSA